MIANHGISKQNKGIGRLLDVCFSIAVTQLCDQGKAKTVAKSSNTTLFASVDVKSFELAHDVFVCMWWFLCLEQAIVGVYAFHAPCFMLSMQMVVALAVIGAMKVQSHTTEDSNHTPRGATVYQPEKLGCLQLSGLPQACTNGAATTEARHSH